MSNLLCMAAKAHHLILEVGGGLRYNSSPFGTTPNAVQCLGSDLHWMRLWLGIVTTGTTNADWIFLQPKKKNAKRL